MTRASCLRLRCGSLRRSLAVLVDYCRIVDPDTLEDVPDVGHGALVAVAARVGSTRLIDNLLL